MGYESGLVRPGRRAAEPRSPRGSCGSAGLLVPGVTDDVRVRDVEIGDDMIRLGQFLKLAGVSDTGGELKFRIADGEVLVNGDVDVRRGRQLRRGDVVTIDGEQIRVG